MRASGWVMGLMLALVPGLSHAGFRFQSIDGGTIALDDWKGKPVLVVNTASLCGYAGQYDDLQAMHEAYGSALLVLAVPSDDFSQELDDEQAVKEYCAVNFDLTLPMTVITPVRGSGAHPFYKWVAAETGWSPGWNFNKVLIGPDGQIAGTWGAGASPRSAQIEGKITAMLQ